MEGTLSLVQDETLSNTAAGASSVGGFSFATTQTTNTTFCLYASGVSGNMSDLRSALASNAHGCAIVPFSGRSTGVVTSSPLTAVGTTVDFKCYTADASGSGMFMPVADGANPFCDPFPGTGFEPATVSWCVFTS